MKVGSLSPWVLRVGWVWQRCLFGFCLILGPVLPVLSFDDDFDFGELIIDDDSPDPLDMATFHGEDFGVAVERWEDQTWEGSFEELSLSVEFREGAPSILIEGDLHAPYLFMDTSSTPGLDLTVTGTLGGELFMANGSTLRIGDGGDSGMVDFDSADGNLGTLELNRSDDIEFDFLDTFDSFLSVGTFRHAGTGTTTLTSPLNVTGSTHIAAGTVLSSADEMNFGDLSVAHGATLDLSGSSGGTVDSINLTPEADAGEIISGQNEIVTSEHITGADTEGAEPQYVPLVLSEGGILRLTGTSPLDVRGGTINSDPTWLNWLRFEGEGEIHIDNTMTVDMRGRINFEDNTVVNNTRLRQLTSGFTAYGVFVQNLINKGTLEVVHFIVEDTLSGDGEVTLFNAGNGRIDANHFTGEQSLLLSGVMKGDLSDYPTINGPSLFGHFDHTGGTTVRQQVQFRGGLTLESDVEMITEYTSGGDPMYARIIFSASESNSSSDYARISGEIDGEGYGYVQRRNSMGPITEVVLDGKATFTRGLTIESGSLFRVGDDGTGGVLNADVQLGGFLDFARADNYEFDHEISGPGEVRQWGEGELLLSGNNTFSGNTLVGNGTVRMGHENAMGNGWVNVWEEAVFDSGDYAFDLLQVIGSGEFKTSAEFIFDSVDDYVEDLRLSGDGVLMKQGTGILTLSGDNVFSGGTQIKETTLLMEHDNALGTGSVKIHEGAVLDSGEYVVDLSLVNGSGDFLSTGGYFYDSDTTHVLEVRLSGENAVEVTGSGPLRLANGANDFTGGITVTEGRLRARDESVLGTAAGNLVLQEGGTLQNYHDPLALSEEREVVLAEGEGRLRAGWNESLSVSGTISGPGALRIVNDSGTVLLSGTNVYEGATIIGGNGSAGGHPSAQEAVLSLAAEGALPDGTTLIFDPGEEGTAWLDLAGYEATVEKIRVLSGTAILENADELVVGSGGIDTGDGVLLMDGDYIFSSDEDVWFAEDISGDNVLIKGGEGSLIYTGEATQSGGTEIEQGVLQLGDGDSLGSVDGSIEIGEGAALALSFDEDFEFSNDTSGEGALIKRGEGIVKMMGENTYMGVTRIEEGGLRLGPASYPSAMGVVEVWEGATFHASRGPVTTGLRGEGTVDIKGAVLWLDIFEGEEETFAGELTGGGRLNKRFDGTQHLTGTVAHAGETNVIGGTMAIPGGISASGEMVTIDDGAILAAGGNIVRDVQVEGNIKTLGGGALELSGWLSGEGLLEGEFILSGITRPGTSPGRLEAEGDVTLSSSHTLELEIGGLEPVEDYDQLAVKGMLTLGGVVEVKWVDDFIPEAAHSFALLNAETLVGEVEALDFSEAELPVDYFWGSRDFHSDGVLDVVKHRFAEWADFHGFEANADYTPVDDGIPLLMKYALGYDPMERLVPSGIKTMEMEETEEGVYLTLAIGREGNVEDVEIVAEVSENLQDWTATEVELIEATEDHLLFRDTVPVEDRESRFLRVRFVWEEVE
ncbi:MAG: autotransporter-associated beta strand repeat-containing protein [Opitutales bacterium]|nr:autotransporter-associated beta strand repeat-containing protein [Opitutales bacterium]MCH8541632.1 autotransporter-associated beta strand repeat-containing protein [Opitutales bacterium]